MSMNTTPHPAEGYTLRWMLYKPGSGKWAYGGLAQVSGQHSLWDHRELFREILASQAEVGPSAFAHHDVVLRGPDDGPFFECLLRQELHGRTWTEAAESLMRHPMQGLPIPPPSSEVQALRQQLELAHTALESIARQSRVDAALDPDWARRLAREALPKVDATDEPHATVSEADGELTVTVHRSRADAMNRLLGFLGEYDDAWAEEAQDTLLATGSCKVPVNLGHHHQVVKISDPTSLQLLRDAKLGRLAEAKPCAVVSTDTRGDSLNASVLLAPNDAEAQSLLRDIMDRAMDSSESNESRAHNVVLILDPPSRALMISAEPPQPRMLFIPCEQADGREYLLTVDGPALARSDEDLLSEIQRVAYELNVEDESSPDGSCRDGRSVQENFEDRLHALGLRPANVTTADFCWDDTSDRLKPQRVRPRD